MGYECDQYRTYFTQILTGPLRHTDVAEGADGDVRVLGALELSVVAVVLDSALEQVGQTGHQARRVQVGAAVWGAQTAAGDRGGSDRSRCMGRTDCGGGQGRVRSEPLYGAQRLRRGTGEGQIGAAVWGAQTAAGDRGGSDRSRRMGRTDCGGGQGRVRSEPLYGAHRLRRGTGEGQIGAAVWGAQTAAGDRGESDRSRCMGRTDCGGGQGRVRSEPLYGAHRLRRGTGGGSDRSRCMGRTDCGGGQGRVRSEPLYGAHRLRRGTGEGQIGAAVWGAQTAAGDRGGSDRSRCMGRTDCGGGQGRVRSEPLYGAHRLRRGTGEGQIGAAVWGAQTAAGDRGGSDRSRCMGRTDCGGGQGRVRSEPLYGAHRLRRGTGEGQIGAAVWGAQTAAGDRGGSDRSRRMGRTDCGGGQGRVRSEPLYGAHRLRRGTGESQIGAAVWGAQTAAGDRGGSDRSRCMGRTDCGGGQGVRMSSDTVPVNKAWSGSLTDRVTRNRTLMLRGT